MQRGGLHNLCKPMNLIYEAASRTTSHLAMCSDDGNEGCCENAPSHNALHGET